MSFDKENLDYDPNALKTYIPYRVFLNHVDSYHGKIISTIVADRIYAPNAGKEDVGEEVAEEEHTEKPTEEPEKIKFEIIGTAKKPLYKPTEDVAVVLKDDETFEKEILKCGFVIYDITSDSNEINKAIAYLDAIEKKLDIDKKEAPKQYEESTEKRVFILISTVLTWANTKPVDPDDPEVPFVETDLKKRRPHANYKEHCTVEKEVMQRAKKHKGKLNVMVVVAGITYGAEEEDLHLLFKEGWYNKPQLPIIQPGNNTIPLLNVKDLASIIAALIENPPPKSKYMLAVEQTISTQKKIVKAVSKSIGSGKVQMLSKSEAFLIPELTQNYYDRMTVNLKMEPNFVINDLGVTYQSELNFYENIDKIVHEYKESRNLLPLRIFFHGPPAVGKTSISKQICELYDLHYVSVATLISDSLHEMHANLEAARARQEEKEAKEAEGAEAEEEGEEEEDEEEDIEGVITEMTDKIKEIERALEEGENGRLPDETVIELLKAKLASNPCQNQGYVLDGYPKTAEQTKQLFDIDEEAGNEEVEEEEDAEGEQKKIIIPKYVISLEADDEFLCMRLMRKPEREIQGTHYTEERMVARLSEFRKNNTEDNTLLNLFDAKEIHPFIIKADTDIQWRLMDMITDKLGDKFGYPPTEEELEAIRKAKELEELEEQRIADEKKKDLEEEMIRDRQKNMETWIDMTNALQEQEEQLLAAQNKPLREYLIKYVFPTLTKGLVEVSRIKPDDPIDYLAEYLFKQNPEGHMFDPTYVKEADVLLNTIKEFQHKVSDFLKLKD